jgi:phenylalanyl-tRNA synthetase beta chain
VLDLGITPNRPDLLSHLGVAREIAAATGRRIKPYKWRATEMGPDVGLLARALVEEPSLCRRYMARVVRNVKVAPSPPWLVERLAAIGQRAINNVVDVTNYVMHELGQPLHAFDLTRLALEANLPTVRVRRAQPGETLRTLDGVDRKLSPEDLVVADAMRPVALAGIMGGMDTWVQEGTTTVLIEGAWFAPTTVRRSAKRHGLRTDASHRFERGCDLGFVSRALDRCAQLLTDVAGGDVAKGSLEVTQKGDGPQEIPLRLERVRQILGLTIGAEAMVQLLDPLGFRCQARTDGALIFEVPTFRPDVTREVDLIEEVARRYGYGKLPERLPNTESAFHFEPLVVPPQTRARAALLPQGCTEVVTYALANPAHMAPFAPSCGEPLRIRNPLGEELSVLRTTLVPGLLGVLRHQLRHGQKTARLFEVGQVVCSREAHTDGANPGQAEAEQPQPPPPEPQVAANGAPAPESAEARAERLASYNAHLPHEALHVACVMHGDRHGTRFYNGGERLELIDAQGALEALLEGFDVQVPIGVRPQGAPGLNPFASGVIEAETEAGTCTLGHIGRIDPTYAQSWDLPEDVFLFELSLTKLNQLPKRAARATPLPKFPATRRDVAVMAPAPLSSEALRQFIVANAGGALGPEVVERVWLFDRYVGKPISDDKVSLAFAISYRSKSQTLTDEAVNAAFADLVALLPQHFDVTLRG